jgi:DNA adenine methylase
MRYPGGKWRLLTFFRRFVESNYEQAPSYIEPYAGGASLALGLLYSGSVKRIWINDFDPAIHACWYSILSESERFCKLVRDVPLTPDEWDRQRSIYRAGSPSDGFTLGFATFYLNRTNHSGILNGGMIGGRAQQGQWCMDARFNRRELIRRLEKIAEYKNRIKLTGIDAADLLSKLRPAKSCLVYLDPPYVRAGQALYMNAYDPADHGHVKTVVSRMGRTWIVSYDNHELVRNLYREYRVRRIELLHTARTTRYGREVLFFSNGASIPVGLK